ncbi:seryl-tRNA synthetase [Saccharothrix tamanrassetensis]|uniref:Seryl-tRNA synthetase n=1 Tax=Saccharothrix tamanrassetensis TaxID=1051531 RepID=A0A841C957_9PSEU|nr:hypothetical protein [Saccharothrix tamanrassetensis]MBB5953671.1 seryl-tRNA synthetase [Saccharothrix tamanrassetensis]
MPTQREGLVPVAGATGGLATIGPDAIRLVELLDACFLDWAGDFGADEVSYPPLLRVADLKRIDYFDNFPQLGMMVAGLRPDGLADMAGHTADRDTVSAERLADSGYVLPSAACYNVYFGLSGSTVDGTVTVTTRGRCFRQETEYVGLDRLLGFTMREIIRIGGPDEVGEFVEQARQRLTAFAEALDLGAALRNATDPFFDSDGPRAAMQRLIPVKQELASARGVAIASVNFHRNFFAERCDITLPDSGFAYSACVGMGLERWISALTERYGDVPSAVRAVEEHRAG